MAMVEDAQSLQMKNDTSSFMRNDAIISINLKLIPFVI